MYIQISGIKKRYGKKTVLTDINLNAESGKCIGIVGGNGCGKSTLFSILAGVTKRDEGLFVCDGAELFSNKKKRSEILGYVPQGAPLFEELSAYDNLRLWYDKENIEYELKNGVLGMLGINSFINVPVNKMSGGMKKRLSIGCSVAHKPSILLLDEPSAALDLVCKESIASYLKAYKKHGGIVLIATHDIGEISLCDELYIMKNGVLKPYIYDGDISRLVGSL